MKQYYTLSGNKVIYNIIDIIIQQFNICGMGNEGVVYKEGERVLKVYHPRILKDRLDLDTAIKLRKIQTDRIIFPGNDDDSLLLDENRNLVAYKSIYIRNLGIKYLLEWDICHLKKEAKILRNDIKILSENNVRTDDFHFGNFSFNKGIYFIDPGSFEFINNSSKDFIYKDNMFRFNRWLLYEIIYGGKYYFTHNKREAKATAMNVYNRYSKSDYPDVVEFIDKEIKEKTLAKYLIK